MIKNKIKNSKGISLITLTITVIVLLILTNIIIYNLVDNLRVEKLRSMQNDIENLRDKISSYYAQNGAIPASMKYTNVDHIRAAGVISDEVDTGDFLVIDLSALENLTLNYGQDFESVRTLSSLSDEDAKNYTNLYIINEASHNIFYVEGIKIDNDIYYTDYTSDEMDLKSVELKYVDGVKIPEGFYYVGGNKDTGLVISDVKGDDLENTKKGNQFVWVPVENMDNFHTIEGYNNGILETLLAKCAEPCTSGYVTEVAEYNAMYASVKNNHGFYIGRFEAGKDTDGNVVVKKDILPYTKIGWNDLDDITNEKGGAVELSKNFAKYKGYTSVTSTLCYGVQWDAIMQFFDSRYINGECDSSSYIVDSTGKDNTGVRNTGSNNAMKNIYDIGENVWEWTMESYINRYRIFRGGSYYNSNPASSRAFHYSNYTAIDVGFRVALYLNLTTVEEAKTKGTVFNSNTELIDTYGNIVTVPEGFKISADSATNVTGGVVIEDVTHIATAGSQFVWIPVGTVYTNADQTESKTIKLGRYEFASDGTSMDYSEDYVEENVNDTANLKNYGNAIAKDIDAFIASTSIKKAGGYYIGRYEAGVTGYDSDSISTDNSNSETNWTGYTGATQLVCKTGQQVWNYVTQNKASELSRNMYSSSEFNSDLMNSYAWDTAIVFIQEFSGYADYSKQGSLQNTLAKTGEATDGTNNDVRCNIYDMAGNALEWTTESTTDSSIPCTGRGGIYNSSFRYTSYRTCTNTTIARDSGSFRPILYIK